MPSSARHVQQALHNYAVYQYLNASSQPATDWQVTMLFYAALHYVDAYLGKMNVHPRSHEDRDAYVSVVADLRRVASSYLQLRDRSMDARYLRRDLPPAIVVDMHAYYVRLRDQLAPRI